MAEFGEAKELAAPQQVDPPAAVLPAPAAVVSESPAIAAYRERLLGQVSQFDLIGLGHGVPINLPIEQAYVPLNVTGVRSLRKGDDGHYDEETLQRREHFDPDVRLCDIFKWAARAGNRGALLLGDPGAGKTTGARQFCWRVLTEADVFKSLGLPAGTIPVFLRLRNLTPEHLTRGLAAFITDGVAATTLPAELANPGPELLARQGVLWIFDGLDEVVNEDARVRACHWIGQARTEHPHDYFLVTSRYQGYQGPVDLGAGFSEFHVKPLEPAQVENFVGNWYRAVYGRLFPDDPAHPAKAEAEVKSLMDLLAEPAYRIGRLRDLPANPLLLTILCLVHHQDHNLPRRRADLYARCVRVLVEHWRHDLRKAQGVAGYLPEAVESVLGAVAWWLHGEDQRITQTVEELGSVAGKALADLAPSAGLGRDGKRFIERMRDESGVLAMWNPGQCGFLHLTFQEYLAGLHAAREGWVEELVAHIDRSWWREAILVAVAIGAKDFAGKFFTALVASDALEKESDFVDQCLDEAAFPVIEPFVEASRQSGPDPVRQLAILRRLRTVQHDDLTALCRDLARSPDADLAALAREILQRAGVAAAVPPIEVLKSALKVSVDTRTDIAFITIPAGEFEMGYKNGDTDEKPVHRVRITQPFRLGKYPVTNAEYQRFLAANPKVEPPAYWNNSQYNDPQQPVVGVSWHDAQAFCQWAGGRLPTEAEWEYACRAGSQSRYCFGDDETQLGEYAWYANNSDTKPHPVGQKKPNEWGLHDMHGNAWEWCEDAWDAAAYQKRQEGATDPRVTSADDRAYRVVRGGSWNFHARYCRAAFRFRDVPGSRWYYLGLRLAAGQEPGGGGAAGRGAPQSPAVGAGAPGPEATAEAASEASRLRSKKSNKNEHPPQSHSRSR